MMNIRMMLITIWFALFFTFELIATVAYWQMVKREVTWGVVVATIVTATIPVVYTAVLTMK